MALKVRTMSPEENNRIILNTKNTMISLDDDESNHASKIILDLMTPTELEERLKDVIIRLEGLLERCAIKSEFSQFLGYLVEEYKMEQELGTGKGISVQDTLNALRKVNPNYIHLKFKKNS